MKIGRVTRYPWYQELIGLSTALFTVWIFAANWNALPDVLATHFNAQGEPDGTMTKLFALLFLGAMFSLFWVLDVFFRYRALVDEQEKRVNWIQFLLNPPLPMIAWSAYIIVDYNLHPTEKLDLALPLLLAALGLSTAFLLITELRREKHEVLPGNESKRRRLAFSASKRFLFVENLLPSWWVPASVVSLLVTVPAAVFMCLHPWIVLKLSGAVTGIAAIVLIFFAGGFRFIVHPKAIEVRLTVGNIPMKIIPIDQVQETGVQEYSALHDFGGWGVRWGANNTTGYIMFGNQGVLIKTANGNYVISSRYADEVSQLIADLLMKAKQPSSESEHGTAQ